MPYTYIPLTGRAVLSIKGDDAENFLQGLITNDIRKATETSGIYALMLTPQGKFLYDFFISKCKDGFLLDCNASRIEEIKKKLAMYKLRSKVTIEDISSEYQVVAITPPNSNIPDTSPDPRSDALPHRTTIAKSTGYTELKKLNLIEGSFEDYENARISLCIPSDNDMGFDKSFPLEFEMDTHNAIDYKKGCYVGQEVTARTHYRGTLRKKPYVVTAPEGTDLTKHHGETITCKGEGEHPVNIGTLCSASKNIAIALLRVEDVEKSGENIEVGGVSLKIS